MKHLLCFLSVCLVGAIEADIITPAKVPDVMSITFFPGQLMMEFKVIVPGTNDDAVWKKMNTEQKVSVSKAHCQIVIRKVGQTREVTFDLFDCLIVVQGDDWSYIKKEMNQFGFAVEARTNVANDHIVGWSYGETNYFANPLYFQAVGGQMYFGRPPETGKAILLSPLRNEPLPVILSLKMSTDSVTFSVNVIDVLDSHKFEYQIVDANGKETGWQPLSKKNVGSVDFTRKFKIQVKSDSRDLVELSFIKNGEFEISSDSLSKWDKLPNLALSVDGVGMLNGKPIEIVGWLVNKTIFPARGSVWISVKDGQLILRADLIHQIGIKDHGAAVAFEPCFGEKKKEPPSLNLVPRPPKKRAPPRRGEFQVTIPAPPPPAGFFLFRH